MTPQRWRLLDEIFQSAVELPQARRGAFLAEACAGDGTLRTEIEKLIAALEKAENFIEGPPPMDLFALPGLAFGPGRRIGPYELIREIGRGGMGAVYLAGRADQEFRQRVAIKLVQAGMDHESIVRRFRNERQILANLDHPNIARLLDGGTTENGSPYFVMEYIEGQPIKAYCDSHQLSIVERLKLFQAVCTAVQYAHQHLVIHRDIKPGNILITGDGVPKLLDFGIAKLTSPGTPAAELTALTSQVMTPEYASPEQVACQPITTVSDIYSLGVLLYELLTGHRPYQLRSHSPLEIAQAICEQEPQKPSAAVGRDAQRLRRQLQGDLDNIVLKAMQKEPGRRYASVEQFSEDIRRHLEGLPVAARTATLSYRAGKFVRRHRAGVAAAALVSLALVAGAAATLWQARVAVQQRKHAERRFNDVRKLANSFLFEFDSSIKDLPGSTPVRSLVMKRALEYLTSLAAESSGDLSLQREMANAYEDVAEIQGNPMFPNLGDTGGALASYRKALAIRESLCRTEPANDTWRRELASLYGQMSDLLDSTGDWPSAVAQSGKSLHVYESLAKRFSNDFAFQVEYAISSHKYASHLHLAGDLDGSLAGYTRAAEISAKLVAARPSDPAGKIHLATSLDGIGGVLQQKGDTAGAVENRRQALAIRTELLTADSNNTHYRRQLGFAHHNLGLSLAEAGEFAQALQHFRYELGIFESIQAADPKDVQAHRNVSLAHKQIGDTLVWNADWNGALDHYRHALDIDRRLSRADPRNSQTQLDLSFSEGKVGWSLGKLGKCQDGLGILRKGVASQELLLSRAPGSAQIRGFLATSYTRLAQSLTSCGETRAALANYQAALESRRSVYAKHPGNTTNRGALAECYLNLAKALPAGESRLALEDNRQAIDLLEKLAAGDVNNAQHRIGLARARANAARLYTRMATREDEPRSLRLEQWREARGLYLQSRDLWSELRRGGKLAAVDRHWPREVVQALSGCDSAIARLTIPSP